MKKEFSSMTAVEKRRYRRRRKKILRRRLFIFFVCVILSAIGIFFVHYQKSHFDLGTKINGISVSELTAEQAAEKIQEVLRDGITIDFIDTIPVKSGNEFYLTVYLEDIEDILKEQKETHTHSFQKSGLFKYDTEELRDYLKYLSPLQEENMEHSKNAYLYVNDEDLLSIKPEMYGNYIDFDKAFTMVCKTIENGYLEVDFNLIAEKTPTISGSSLVSTRDEINKALSTTINYTLIDGSTFVLNKTIMKDWLVQEKNGKYSIDFDTNIPKFVNELSEKIGKINSVIDFTGTGMSHSVKVSIKKGSLTTLDKEKEISSLKEELITGETFSRKPIYSNILDMSNLKNYVEIDLTRQNVWLYINGECIIDSPCVTGSIKGGHATPTGLFYLTYKTTDTYLKGTNNDGSKYNSHVNFWMPFNGGIGMHDASWRKKFGGTIYQKSGSHGCINMPYDAAKTVYEHINSSMPIIVYNSSF